VSREREGENVRDGEKERGGCEIGKKRKRRVGLGQPDPTRSFNETLPNSRLNRAKAQPYFITFKPTSLTTQSKTHVIKPNPKINKASHSHSHLIQAQN
jgi:hypothetical protein